MEGVNPKSIESYQLLYEQNPKSKIFAPLAEAYRKMGLLKEALEVAESGVSIHSNFAGGYVALGKIFLDLNKVDSATKSFQKAAELAPENIVAQSALGELLLKQKDPKGALKAYKMLLFLQPENKKALKAVSKLESLTADEYDDDVFSMQPLKETVKNWENISKETLLPLEPQVEGPQVEVESETTEKKMKQLGRLISLADAFFVRNDIDRAQEAIEEAERQFGQHPEIVKRLHLLSQNHMETAGESSSTESQQTASLPNRDQQAEGAKIHFLKGLLNHISQTKVRRNS